MKIYKIQKSIKPCFELKTTRSLKVKCSTSVDRYDLNDYKSIEEIFNKIKN